MLRIGDQHCTISARKIPVGKVYHTKMHRADQIADLGSTIVVPTQREQLSIETDMTDLTMLRLSDPIKLSPASLFFPSATSSANFIHFFTSSPPVRYKSVQL